MKGAGRQKLLFAGTIFSSAFLLFLVQPLIAKQILPWFGGSAAVWSICMVFFQVVLLGGYGYADWVTRRLSPRGQSRLHLLLLAASLAFLPIVAGTQWKPAGDEDPTLWILGLLLATIGLPYFLLSTTGPLVQSWLARAPWGSQVYRYFSLSNGASLASLLAYPVLIEPHSTLLQQAWGWSIGYAVFAVLCAGTTLYAARLAASSPALADAAAQAVEPEVGPPPGLADHLLWLALPALGSWLLLAVTNHITQNVAAIPFLWVLPLSVYLLSFVLTFESDRWYRRRLVLPLAGALLLGCAVGLQSHLGSRLQTALPLYVGGLFVLCLFLHGEMARRRPGPRHLTRFYLMLSLGGALGGIAVGLVAPQVLPAYYELGIGLVLTAAAGAWVLRGRRWGVALSLLLALACAGFLALQVQDDLRDARHLSRNFYGTLITADVQRDDARDNVRVMFHGSVKHGEQLLAADRRREPTAYYGETSGIGRALAAAPDGPRRIGVIGLGTGTLAAYGRAGDVIRLYEINPEVFDLAAREFSFVGDSRARIENVLGDARLALEREAPQRFDVLAIDAFSGDSVPVHLITVQAMDVYLRHLKPGGVIAFHVTNRFLALPPVVQQVAQARGLHAVLVHDEGERAHLRATDWVLVAREAATLDRPGIREASVPFPAIPGLRPWTDDFNNLFGVLK
ncbi:spermidine synthase [Aquabacterium sp. J223]|uniref:spermidine synthase n=1 Tax=Aquabacterium sp. J223 TaxID=2898431 RepID=UPI0021AD7B8D|nr:fused MFS/spermidine synthase [Aquabacterium sp. J223]UUX94736.1 fused MFS/spermidine synthase [Aquabacterium sp. J223]